MGHRVSARSTLGTFLRALTFGPSASLTGCWLTVWGARGRRAPDRVTVSSLWMLIRLSVRSTAMPGRAPAMGTRANRVYRPIVATRSRTGRVLHSRARKGSANTSRGALRSLQELIARVRASGPKLLRADSGFWNQKSRGSVADSWLDVLDRGPPTTSCEGRDHSDPGARLADARGLPAGGEAQIAQTMLSATSG